MAMGLGRALSGYDRKWRSHFWPGLGVQLSDSWWSKAGGVPTLSWDAGFPGGGGEASGCDAPEPSTNSKVLYGRLLGISLRINYCFGGPKALL